MRSLVVIAGEPTCMGKAKLAGKLVNRFGMGHHCVDELAARCNWKMMELSLACMGLWCMAAKEKAGPWARGVPVAGVEGS